MAWIVFICDSMSIVMFIVYLEYPVFLVFHVYVAIYIQALMSFVVIWFSNQVAIHISIWRQEQIHVLIHCINLYLLPRWWCIGGSFYYHNVFSAVLFLMREIVFRSVPSFSSSWHWFCGFILWFVLYFQVKFWLSSKC